VRLSRPAAGSRGIARSARRFSAEANGEGGNKQKSGGRPGIRPAPPLKGLGLDSPGDAVPFFNENPGNARRAERPLLSSKKCYWPQWHEFSRRMVDRTRARDRHRMAETPAGRLRERRRPPDLIPT
jgi:hypothetical protein